MEDADLAYSSAADLREMLHSKKLSPVELTELYLRRIETLNPRLNAFLTVTGDHAMESARQAETAIARGERGPLLGMPIAIKDLEATKGIRTTFGSLVFQDHVPDRDAVGVARVRAAGAVILGKTNTPEFGPSGTTTNKLGDACRNPWDTQRTPGGSSGGSASAVAAGLAPIAIGSDGAGSIRIPASLCGIYGIKPTQGRVPSVGSHDRPTPHLTAQSGPITRYVADAAALLQVMSGRDPGDPTSLRETPPDFSAGLEQGARGLKLAWSADMGYGAVDEEVLQSANAAAYLFQELGATVQDTNLRLDPPMPAYLDISRPSMVAAYQGVLDDHRDQLMDYVNQALDHGENTTGADFSRAMRAVEVMCSQLDDLLDEYDLLLTPTMGMVAPPVGQPPTSVGGKEVHPQWIFPNLTVAFNLTGQPAATVPCGFSSDGLPIGLHIVGRRGDEQTVIAASAAFEGARPWIDRRPPVS
jgi:aspartyl-tRNA(Asn)/glutamyl-tRNA(Gln) amidotransferase subunit A